MAQILTTSFIMLLFTKDEDLGHPIIQSEAHDPVVNSKPTTYKSNPLDKARHTFNGSSIEFLKRWMCLFPCQTRTAVSGTPFEPRTGSGQVFNTCCSQMLSTLKFFPQAQNIFTKKKKREKDDEYALFA